MNANTPLDEYSPSAAGNEYERNQLDEVCIREKDSRRKRERANQKPEHG